MKNLFNLLTKECKSRTETVCLMCAYGVLLAILPASFWEYCHGCAILSLGCEIGFLYWMADFVEKHPEMDEDDFTDNEK